MALVTTDTTILKTYEYSETSKILRLLTRDHGLCSVIAKGARRPKSRFGGLLEPFTDGMATYYAKQGRDLHTLSAFELRKERQALGLELVRYAGAGLITEIILRYVHAAADRRLFARFRGALDRLMDDDGHPEAIILQESWRLIAALGFGPNLERCTGCDDLVPSSGRAGYFDLPGGGFRCDRCAESSQAGLRSLPGPVREELVALIRGRAGRNGSLRTARTQRHLLRDFLTYHLTDGRPLNSFRFLEEQLL